MSNADMALAPSPQAGTRASSAPPLPILGEGRFRPSTIRELAFSLLGPASSAKAISIHGGGFTHLQEDPLRMSIRSYETAVWNH
jgi:hypothetical protein